MGHIVNNNKQSWKIAIAKVQGKLHADNDTPCQDFVGKLKSNDVVSLALSDGAGSKLYSHIGSEIVVKKALRFINLNFDFLYTLSASKASKLIVEHIITSLKKQAEKQNFTTKEYAATLLFASVKKDKFFLGHLGDGVLGMYEDDSFVIISEPHNSEYANVTFFITDNNADQNLHIQKGFLENRAHTIGFILMSDGTAESLYNKQSKQFGNGCKTFLKWFSRTSATKMNAILQQNLEGIISKKTTDDCSIGLMLLSNLQKENVFP
ncbi:MAG: protein phosphatase 2C domain-containing protein [Campylobacterales bacterium]|nr:protein phosphatase 2C domain-containing protein [Campylobacterales bacterium]